MRRMVWCLFCLTTALAAQPPCAIRGIIVDAFTNQPLPRTRVFAEINSTTDDDSTPPVRQITDASGKFCFEKLTAGKYAVRASRAYYIDVQYGEHWLGVPGQFLKISPDSPEPFVMIKMTPQAVISGVLMTADGDPLQGAQIELLKGRWKERKLMAASIQGTTTDDQGRYRFAGLAAGTYFLSAAPALERNGMPFRGQYLDQTRQPFRQVESKTYYRNAISFREATPVRVSAGQEIGGLNLTFRTAEARHVSGQVAPEVLNNSSRTLYFYEEDSGHLGTWLSVPLQNDGHFLAEGLFPSRYEIRGAGIVHKTIDLTQEDIDSVVLESNQPIELGITVHWQGVHSRPIRNLTLFNRTPDIDEDIRSVKAQLITENRFKAFARPGHYQIEPEGGSEYFIKGLVVDGKPQSGSILDLQGGTQKSIDLFLSSELASVEVRVISSQPIGNGVTLLLENESEPESSFTEIFSPEEEFKWTFSQPGKYRLYAFEEFSRDIWETPGLATMLATKSNTLDVKEGQHQHVSVPLISMEDVQSALKRTNF